MTKNKAEKLYQKEYHFIYYKNKKEKILNERIKILNEEINYINLKWKKIDETYIISSCGYVINKKRMILKKIYKNKSGYLLVSINKISKMYHRLLAEAFIDNPENKPEVNHKNGIRDDNRIENLEWCTRQENIQHSFRELGRISNFKGSNHKRGRKKKC